MKTSAPRSAARFPVCTAAWPARRPRGGIITARTTCKAMKPLIENGDWIRITTALRGRLPCASTVVAEHGLPRRPCDIDYKAAGQWAVLVAIAGLDKVDGLFDHRFMKDGELITHLPGQVAR